MFITAKIMSKICKLGNSTLLRFDVNVRKVTIASQNNRTVKIKTGN